MAYLEYFKKAMIQGRACLKYNEVNLYYLCFEKLFGITLFSKIIRFLFY